MTKKDDSIKPVPSKKEVNLQVKDKKEMPSKKTINKADVVKNIVSLYNDGISQSQIGLILKDKHKVKSVKQVTGSTIKEILIKEKVLSDLPEDLENLLKKSVALVRHMKDNKKDTTAKRGYQLTVSKIRRLAKYYRSKRVLPKTWKYDDKKAALLVK